jgi:DNA-binding LacI/PurR family transcriptional regulator
MSINRVARRAGVSKSTVSRVLNGECNVAFETSEKVISAVKEIGYKLPESGRCGRPRKSSDGLSTGNIAILFPYEETREETPLTARLIHGFSQTVERKGLNLVLGQFSPYGDPPSVLERVKSDAVIVRPGSLGREVAKKLKVSVPAVWLFEQWSGILPENVDNVMPDNARTGELAAQYLMNKGHQRLVVVNPFFNHACCNTRARKFKETAGNLGCDVLEIYEDSAVEVLAKKVIQVCSIPAGIFVPNSLPGFYESLYMLDSNFCLKSNWIYCQVEKQQMAAAGDHIACIDMRFEDIAEAAIETALWRLQNRKKSPRRVMIGSVIQ